MFFLAKALARNLLLGSAAMNTGVALITSNLFGRRKQAFLGRDKEPSLGKLRIWDEN